MVRGLGRVEYDIALEIRYCPGTMARAGIRTCARTSSNFQVGVVAVRVLGPYKNDRGPLGATPWLKLLEVIACYDSNVVRGKCNSP
jgi:hypothetical protein